MTPRWTDLLPVAVAAALLSGSAALAAQGRIDAALIVLGAGIALAGVIVGWWITRDHDRERED